MIHAVKVVVSGGPGGLYGIPLVIDGGQCNATGRPVNQGPKAVEHLRVLFQFFLDLRNGIDLDLRKVANVHALRFQYVENLAVVNPLADGALGNEFPSRYGAAIVNAGHGF